MNLFKRACYNGLISVLLSSYLLERLLVDARSTGAPVGSNPEICTTMTPGHQIPSSLTDSPYNIGLSSDSYKPGEDLIVTISTAQPSAGLKGILLVMREAVTHEILGSWSVADSTNFQAVSCGNQNDTVTHRNSNVKALTTAFTWTPPDIGGPDIYVAASFVRDYSTFWVNVTSPPIPDACKALFNGVAMCSNHGTCASLPTGGLECICEPGYTGITCQNQTSGDPNAATGDPCSSNACMNGATCVPDVDGGNYTCTCPQGYTGPMCDVISNVTVDPCSSNNCMMGATCVPDVSGETYTCRCAQGFTGPQCNVEVNNQDVMTTPPSTTAQGYILTWSVVLTVSALWFTFIINARTLA